MNRAANHESHPVQVVSQGCVGAGSSPCKREVGCTTSNDRGVLSGLEHMAYHPIALQSLGVRPAGYGCGCDSSGSSACLDAG